MIPRRRLPLRRPTLLAVCRPLPTNSQRATSFGESSKAALWACPLWASTSTIDREVRSGLVATQMMGLAMMR